MDDSCRSGRCRSATRASSRRSRSASTSRRASRSGQATDADPESRWRDSARRPRSIRNFQGTAQAFQQSLGTVPLLIMAALVVVYLILGILYESYIHPLTILSTLPSAGVGALAILMVFGFDFSLIALDRHHSA